MAASKAPGSDGAAASQTTGPDKSSYANYLWGGAGTEEGKLAWSDSTKGRAAIRLISRGIIGSAFFTVGGRIAAKQMAGYEFFGKAKNPLQHVAKAIDGSIGRALETAAFHFTPGDLHTKAKAARHIVRFRSKTFTANVPYYCDRWNISQPMSGRTLGEEAVMVTADFFMGSFGDAMTRNIIQGFDPNVKQPWMLDDQGHATTWKKGHFHLGKFMMEAGRTGFRVLTKNAGEDVAVAIPYVYQMKVYRQMISHVCPGFKLSSDHNWNGGLSKVTLYGDAKRGLKPGQITGSYQGPGALDLTLRFPTYNFDTLMYNDLYDNAAYCINKVRHEGLHVSLPTNPIMAAVDGVGFTARYMLKSAIKASIYMFPAMPFFWAFRTPQSKAISGFAVEHVITAADGSPESRMSSLITTKPIAPAQGSIQDPVFLENVGRHVYTQARLIHEGPRPDTLYYGNIPIDMKSFDQSIHTIASTGDKGHPYLFSGIRRGWFGHVLNPFGYLCYEGGSKLTHAVDYLTNKKVGAVTKWLSGPNATLLDREKNLRTYVNAWAYYPYMWAKTETKLRVDDRRNPRALGHQDKAIYRLIDSFCRGDFKGAGEAANDVWRLSLDFEKEVKSREGGVLTDGEGETPVPAIANLKTSINDNKRPLPRGETQVAAGASDAAPISKVEGHSIAHQGKQDTPKPIVEGKANDNLRPAANDGPDDAHKWGKAVVNGREASFHRAHPTVQ